MITALRLHNFRNHASFFYAPPCPRVVLYGANGSGKTNILEALSLLSPGRGLRGDTSSAMDRLTPQPTTPWEIDVTCQSQHGLITLKLSHETGGERRTVKLDDKPLSSQRRLSDYLTVVWLTPEFDAFFRDSPSLRRRFVDRLVFASNPLHAEHVSLLEKLQRERLRLLIDGPRDRVWLDRLEQQIASAGLQVMTNRRQVVQALNTLAHDHIAGFPALTMAMHGTAETLLETADAAAVYAAYLSQQRDNDTQKGSTGYGAQRSDLHVVHADKNQPALACSSGEQKALLFSVVLAHAALLQQQQRQPLLLLDEACGHLDALHRAALLQHLAAQGLSCWVTGTDQNLFTAWENNASFLTLTPEEKMRAA